MHDFFQIKKRVLPDGMKIPLSEQKRRWLWEYSKTFSVVFFAYLAMYLIRTNFKAAKPLLIEQYGISIDNLANIGIGFSIIYGVGKLVMGYFIVGKNSKRILSTLLICAAISVMLLGLVLDFIGGSVFIIMILWGCNGLFQAGGAPAAYSTIYRWTPRSKRATSVGAWNASYNIGGGIAGIVALWGANTFFHGSLPGMFIFPALIALTIGIIGLFWGKDDPEELGWERVETIFAEPLENGNASNAMSDWQIFKTLLLGNPWAWFLCITIAFGYVLRIGIDSWLSVYVRDVFHFSKQEIANAYLYLEIGAMCGGLACGVTSDRLSGRNAIVAIVCFLLTMPGLKFYTSAQSVTMINTMLFILGFLISGALIMTHLALINLVPKKSVSVAYGMAGTFAYIFGSTAGKSLGKIARPEGISLFGQHLQGWSMMFTVFYIISVVAIALLIAVAVVEERKIRALAKTPVPTE